MPGLLRFFKVPEGSASLLWCVGRTPSASMQQCPTIIPGQVGTYRHLRARVTPLFTDSGQIDLCSSNCPLPVLALLPWRGQRTASVSWANKWLFLLSRHLGGADDLVNDACWRCARVIGYGHEDQRGGDRSGGGRTGLHGRDGGLEVRVGV